MQLGKERKGEQSRREIEESRTEAGVQGIEWRMV